MSQTIYIIIIAVLTIGLIGGFIYSNDQKDTGTVSGKITIISGNCMPMACDNPPCESSCSIAGTSTNIYIMEVASYSNNMDGTYLKKNNKPNLIKTLTSGSDGSYIVILPVGKYSLFVEDNGKEYCNSWDGQGNSCVFEIKKDQTTEYNSKINHAFV